jgi:hypothetical protein
VRGEEGGRPASAAGSSVARGSRAVREDGGWDPMDGGTPAVDGLEFASNSAGGRHRFAAAAAAVALLCFAYLVAKEEEDDSTQVRCCSTLD